ncbi:RluA family pseudouridine synthase [Clostridium thermobutyricum]|uniref:Pseudouridine synthase n=1 Tax=Clostridium thermobutyricum DSM 4928 TaxID=1121339 RepID=A0A1V4SXD7_9CLOT|nr:RluA family pseudouridine synthase [Clostridium thermobutyricum]OPX49233.1 ribosomal large subunit pseudouridine synthase D [Clostridium thermobutyricum DSM 4928]
MSTLERIVDEKYDGCKIREFLKEEMELSSRLIRKSALDKKILVNNEWVKMNFKIKKGDNIKVILNRKETQDIAPEDIDIEVVYEDSNLLVVNKKPFMVVHPTKRYQSGTLANGVMNHFKNTNQECIVRLANRLDMNTSGLVIIAKNQFAHMFLSNEMQKNEVTKKYLTVVHGHLKEKSGTVDAPIYRVPEEEEGVFSIRRVVDEKGQRSITHYRVVESLKDADLVECTLETGRTHQIRVHMAHLGHPIYGDFLYGDGDNEKDLIERQALHAYSLEFLEPKERKLLSLKAELPEDIKELINKLK